MTLDTLLFYDACGLFFLFVMMFFFFFQGNRSIQFLKDIAPVHIERSGREQLDTQKPLEIPHIYVVIAGRNEAKTLEKALTHLLNQDYPNLTLLFVNDRSEDDTAQVVQRIQHAFNVKNSESPSTRLSLLVPHLHHPPKLECITLETLPEGWLGKTHALFYGTQTLMNQHPSPQENDYFLFTDADIVLEPTALRRVIAYAQSVVAPTPLDHLTISPMFTMKGFGLNLYISGFTLFFSLFAKPWIANQPHTDEAIGIGAFNLVRVGAYQKTGGHQRIPLCVDDDIKLGKLLKHKGCSQRILYGVDMVKVDWYASIPDMIEGLSKNAFAGVGFQEGMVVWTVVSQLLFIFPPYVSVLYATGWTQLLFAASIILITAICYDNNRFHGLDQRIGILAGLLFPVSSTLMMISVVNSCLKTLKNKGIYWRETFYPLSVLKQGLQTFSNHLKEASPVEGISRESL